MKITDYEILERLYKNFPELVKEMNDVSHNASDKVLNPYHLEGSIWTHTMMVYNYACTKQFPLVVKFAALLHDVGKTRTKKTSCTKNQEKLREALSVMMEFRFL